MCRGETIHSSDEATVKIRNSAMDLKTNAKSDKAEAIRKMM
jgi:hypothetical protein